MRYTVFECGVRDLGSLGLGEGFGIWNGLGLGFRRWIAVRDRCGFVVLCLRGVVFSEAYARQKSNPKCVFTAEAPKREWCKHIKIS